MAASTLVEAFAANDTARYFACFSHDATFVLHTEPDVMWDRDSYLARWRSWEADGFHVQACQSVDGRVQLLGPDTAAWIHQVRTQLAGVAGVQHERETIIFHRADGRWLAVHEHLSPGPPPKDQP